MIWFNPSVETIKGEYSKMEYKQEGMKFDNGKNRLGLVFKGFAKALEQVGWVGTFGANKYKPDSWQTVPDAKKRYMDALLRHLFSYLKDDIKDDESGLNHLSHVAWNALAVLNLEIEESEIKEGNESI